jgi:hypothetical protein
VPDAGFVARGQFDDDVEVVCPPPVGAKRNSFAPDVPPNAIAVPVQSGLASLPLLYWTFKVVKSDVIFLHYLSHLFVLTIYVYTSDL